MFNIDYKDTNWWYLLVCGTGMTLGLTGWNEGYLLAIATATVQLIHALVSHRSLAAFSVQVRASYVLIFLAAYPAPMNWLYWIPAIGTWVYIFFNYCILARSVSLLPFYRRQPFSLSQVRDTYLARPGHNILNIA